MDLDQEVVEIDILESRQQIKDELEESIVEDREQPKERNHEPTGDPGRAIKASEHSLLLLAIEVIVTDKVSEIMSHAEGTVHHEGVGIRAIG